MNETIRIYLLEALRLYLSHCEEKEKKPNEEIRNYFIERIEELKWKVILHSMEFQDIQLQGEERQKLNWLMQFTHNSDINANIAA